jgi:hypothetical protein
MNEEPPGSPRAITFMVRTSAAVFQSPSPPEAIAVCHQPLRGDTRQLPEAVQILKGVCEGALAALLKECPQA